MNKRPVPEIILVLVVFLLFFVVFSMNQEELLQNLRTGISEASGSDLLRSYWIVPVRELLSLRQ